MCDNELEQENQITHNRTSYNCVDNNNEDQ